MALGVAQVWSIDNMIYAIDVGSTIPKRSGVAFAWSAVDDNAREVRAGSCPGDLVADIATRISQGESVALGIEAPLFIPVPSDKANLSKGRLNEGDRSWAAPAGGYVTALAVHQCAWLLRELYNRCGQHCRLATEPEAWYRRAVTEPVIFCWEAFVSGPAHGNHADDARTAAMYFHSQQTQLVSAVTAENLLSLFGAAVMWSGWSADPQWLKQPIVVLRPDARWAPR